MTLLERVRWIREHSSAPKLLVNGDDFNTVEDLLNRDEVKKPVRKHEKDRKAGKCPRCKAEMYITDNTGDIGIVFCHNCGQKMDWR